MATATTTTADALLLNEVEPEVAEAFNKEVLLFDLATKSKTPWMGRKKIFDVMMSTGGGIGTRSEVYTGSSSAPALPAPGAPSHVNGEIYAKRMYGTLELTHDAIEQSRGPGAAFREILADNLEATLLRMKKYANFCAFGDGRGILATVVTGATLASTNGDAQQITVDSTRYLSQGDIIAFWTSNAANSTVLANGGQSYVDGTYDSEAVRVKSVDSDTLVTVERTRAGAGSAVIATGNVIRLYLGAEYNASANILNDPMGLRGMADDGTIVSTFEGISRTTYPKWKGNVIAASSTAEGTQLAKNHFVKMAHRIHRVSGLDPNVFIMDPSMLREFLAITDQDVRYQPVSDKDPGFEGNLRITIGGKQVPLFTDFDCPYGVVYAFPKEKLELHELTPLQLDNSNGSVLKQAKPYGAGGGVGDIYYAYFRAKFNWATRFPFAMSVLTGLNYASDLA